jgi:hypothetical protein
MSSAPRVLRLLPVLAVSTALALLVLACSSKSASKGGSLPTCQGAQPSSGSNSAACTSCVESSCSSDLSSVESACSAYLGCYSGCQCSDGQCIANCQSQVTSNCESALTAGSSCEAQNCPSQCSDGTPDGG